MRAQSGGVTSGINDMTVHPEDWPLAKDVFGAVR